MTTTTTTSETTAAVSGGKMQPSQAAAVNSATAAAFNTTLTRLLSELHRKYPAAKLSNILALVHVMPDSSILDAFSRSFSDPAWRTAIREKDSEALLKEMGSDPYLCKVCEVWPHLLPMDREISWRYLQVLLQISDGSSSQHEHELSDQ